MAILLVITAGVAWAARQKDPPCVGDRAEVSLGWPALVAGMEKMHLAIASAESSGNSDSDFVALMLPHHQAAIDMARAELLYGQDPQMRRLAQEILTDQQSEIELMQLWLKRHGPDAAKDKRGSQVRRNKEQ